MPAPGATAVRVKVKTTGWPAGEGFEDEFKKLPEGLYRTVLENLAIAAKVRKQVKG